MFVAVVADRAPGPQHDLRELRVGHVGAAEHRLHQLVAAHRAIPMLDQADQTLENARGQSHGFAAEPQFAGGQIERVFPETIPNDAHGCR